MVEAMEIQEGFKKTEVGVIPSDWKVQKLTNIAEICTGSTPPTSDPNNYGDDYYFVSPADLGKGRIILNTEKKLSLKGFNLSRKYPKNSILFTCIGSTIGKSGIADIELTSNQQINAIFPNNTFDSDYLYYLLNLLANKIKQSAGETAVPIINKTEFGELSFPLPSTKAEQTAIATALNDADALITQLEKLIAKKRAIKQGAMQELLKPKEGWEVKKLGEIAEISKGEQLNKANMEDDDLYPVMNGGISPSGFTDKCNTKGETIIISEGGNSCGYVNFIKTAFWRGGHCYEVKTKIHELFLFQLLKFNEKAIMNLRVGSGLPNIQKNRIDNFDLTIPDPEEQTRIAQILSDMDAEIEALGKKLEKYKMLKQGMMQNLLTGRIRLV